MAHYAPSCAEQEQHRHPRRNYWSQSASTSWTEPGAGPGTEPVVSAPVPSDTLIKTEFGAVAVLPHSVFSWVYPSNSPYPPHPDHPPYRDHPRHPQIQPYQGSPCPPPPSTWRGWYDWPRSHPHSGPAESEAYAHAPQWYQTHASNTGVLESAHGAISLTGTSPASERTSLTSPVSPTYARGSGHRGTTGGAADMSDASLEMMGGPARWQSPNDCDAVEDVLRRMAARTRATAQASESRTPVQLYGPGHPEVGHESDSLDDQEYRARVSLGTLTCNQIRRLTVPYVDDALRALSGIVPHVSTTRYALDSPEHHKSLVCLVARYFSNEHAAYHCLFDSYRLSEVEECHILAEQRTRMILDLVDWDAAQPSAQRSLNPALGPRQHLRDNATTAIFLHTRQLLSDNHILQGSLEQWWRSESGSRASSPGLEVDGAIGSLLEFIDQDSNLS